jgi:hypothetical protein
VCWETGTGGSNPPLSASKEPMFASGDDSDTCEPRFFSYPLFVQQLSRSGCEQAGPSMTMATNTVVTPMTVLVAIFRPLCVAAC